MLLHLWLLFIMENCMGKQKNIVFTAKEKQSLTDIYNRYS